MEKNTDGKRKTDPSIPGNYISILQLQERWINDKKRKQKENKEEEAEEIQPNIFEDDLKKAEVTVKQKERNIIEEKCLDRSNRKHWDRNSRKKESIDGGEAKSAEKDEPEVTLAMGSERGEDPSPIVEGIQEKKRRVRKRSDSKKKKKKTNQYVVECGSIAPPEIIMMENKTPVNDVIRVYRKKVEKATMETKFEKLSIKEGETKNLEAKTKSSKHNRPNQRQSQRASMPIGTATMVWMKKEQNDGIGSGIKSPMLA